MNRLPVVVALLLLHVAVLQSQEVAKVAGVVRDRVTGAAIAGAQVTVVGTRLATTTDRDGRFALDGVPIGTLTVRARTIGYGSADQTVAVALGEATAVEFALQPQALELEGVVVVGYGTLRSEDITGAVADLRSEDFIQGPARDAATLIAGKVAGLAITRPSGNPTSTAQIQLRGVTTVNGSRSPLVVVDGVPGDLQSVAAQDIEAISVLKDGSAAAIYGSRASNGVVLITTKRHAGGDATFRYDSYVSQSTIYQTPDFLTAADYRRLIADGYAFQDLGSSTNWQRAVLRSPMSYRHNLALSGGATNTNYNASLNVEREEGIFQRSGNGEVTGRANIRHQMLDGKLEAEANVLSRTQTSFLGPDYDYTWRQTLIRNPTDRVMDDSGRWQQQGGYFYVNPVSLIQESNGEDETRSTRLHGSLTLRPVEHLRLSVMGGTSRSNWLRGFATTWDHPNHTQGNDSGYASRTTNAIAERILEITGTYANRIGDHSVTLLGGYAYQDRVEEGFFAGNSKFPTDLFDWNQLQRGAGMMRGLPGTGISSDKWDRKTIGFFGRLNYDWKGRYLLMGSVRYEGDSRFGADHKWGLFPAVSAGWRISQEGFMRGVRFVNDLRLRAGYGVTGIAPTDPYGSLATYAYGQRFLYDGEWIQGLAPNRNPNPDLRWEQKQELNVGLNLSAFDTRLAAVVDVYRRDTKDMLFGYTAPNPPFLPFNVTANVGTMRNSGIEVELSYDVVRQPRARWTTSANLSTNSNRLVTLSNETFAPPNACYTTGGTGEPIQKSTHQVCVGQPIGNFYGFESVGIDSTGQWIVLDAAGNRIPLAQKSDADRRVLGNGLPKYYVAWNNTAQIGNVDLSVSVRGALDFQILNFMRLYYENPQIIQYNMLRSAFDLVYGKEVLNSPLEYVSYYIEDGGYIKLDNATIGYTLPRGVAGHLLGARGGARVYLSGRNLLTLTKYRGLDPEVSLIGLSPGNDNRDTYPTIRTFTAGVTFNF
jgi:TonB-linked SusC/RagA family outer membrane protein